VKDPIKYYFLEKIQITLANKASLKIMILKKNDEGNSLRKRKKSQKTIILVIYFLPPPPTIPSAIKKNIKNKRVTIWIK